MPEERTYRQLTAAEIEALEADHCTAEDWTRVLVDEDFRTGCMHAAAFSGDIRLGTFEGTLSGEGGVRCPSGIYHATLHNCVVDDDVRIANVSRYVANYDIGSGALIENVGILCIDGESTFGNGTRVRVMTESGGREIPMTDDLTAQKAYVLAFCRQRTDVTARLETLLAEYVDSVRSMRGSVGAGARVVDSHRILNVAIGPAACITGALALLNGSINSTPAAPSRIEDGAIAKDFILAPSARVTGGTRIERCFVGEGVHLSEQFVADNSIFFANCDLARGEASSVFAGPFTQSHHRSTLLLAAHYSFHNAGSGTNLSNHHYKLGPVHQGVFERGCKTGSGSYLLWPSILAPFTTVIGRHKQHIDTSAFPFSYLFEGEHGQSLLLPGANIFNIGLYRDNIKWRDRDRRPPGFRRDLYRSGMHTPCTVGRMIRARNILSDLNTHAPLDQPVVDWKGTLIPRQRVHRGWQEYNLAVSLYLGERVAMCVETVVQLAGLEHVEQRLLSTRSWGLGDWVDVGGMPLPRARLDRLLDQIADGDSKTLADVDNYFKEQHEAYAQMEWNWVLTTWLQELDRPREELGMADIEETLLGWKDTLRLYEERLLADAEKEFTEESAYGYGIASEGDTAAADFAAVRGSLDDDPSVQSLRTQVQTARERADRLLQKLGGSK